MASKVSRGLRAGGLAIALTAAAAGATTASAADRNKNYFLWGIGRLPCQGLTSELEKNKDIANVLASWVFGYITASNRYINDTYDVSPITDPSALLNLVVSLCQQHGEANVESVTASLVNAFAPAKVQTNSPVIEVKAGNATAQVHAETLTLIQTRLGQLGLLKGKPEAQFTPRLEAALKNYQKEQKLPESGVPDTATIFRLLVQTPQKAR